MPDLILALAIASAIGSALIAGTFFAFSTFVMPALRRAPPAEGIRAMQAINVTVINPWFMGAFVGTVATSLAAAIAALIDWDDAYGPWIVAACLLYVAGCFGVTMAFNVPRNDALERLDADAPDAPTAWDRYAREWTAWNTVRTLGSLAALACLIVALANG